MLDRAVVKELINSYLADSQIPNPQSVSVDTLVETFCLYTEDDYYEWIKDNLKSFFNYSNPDWQWIQDRIRHYQKQS